MKACPYCAEQIQDEAKVCKHCGRSLTRKKRSNTPLTAIFVVLILVLVVVVFSKLSQPGNNNAHPTSAATTEPNEPCIVEAPAEARAAAQNWCQGGLFTNVAVKYDATNFVVTMKMSRKGQRVWAADTTSWLNRFRGLTDQMVDAAHQNVAFSFFGTDGQMAGGCTRKRSALKSTCNAK